MSADGVRRTVDLNELRRAARASAPPRPVGSASSRRNGPAPSPALARSPFVIMLAASVLCLIIRFVPEVAFAPEVFAAVYAQAHVVAWVPGDDGFLGVCMFVALILTAVTASRRLVDDLIWVPTLIVVMVLTASSIAAIVRDGVQNCGIGIAVALCVVLTLWQASRQLAQAQANPAPPRLPLGLVLALIVTVLPALAVGRALFGRPVADVVVTGDTRASAFLTPSTLWLWGAGSLVCVLVALVVSLLPPARSARRLLKLIVGVLVGAALVTYVAPAATASAREEAARLQAVDVTAGMPSYCTWWSRPSESGPPITVVFSGPICSSVDVYTGSVLHSSEQLPYDLSIGGRFDTTRDLPAVVSGVYGDVIAVGVAQSDGTPGVIGVDFLTGALAWQVMCPAGTQTPGLRFAGTSSEDPSVLRQTFAGEGQGIILTCDGTVNVLPPHP